jgi:hypothetical protein
MKESTNSTQKRASKASLITLLLSIFVLIFWIIGTRLLNVYKVALIGAIFELMWLPMIICLFALPIWSLYNLIKNRVIFKSLYFYSIVISVSTIILLIA